MYQYSYSEVLADDPTGAKEQERFALGHAIALLEAAASAEPHGVEQAAALHFVTQLWGILIKDLAHPGNDLPAALKANLMSIGLWIMATAQRIQAGESRDFQAIIDVCCVIRDGLA